MAKKLYTNLDFQNMELLNVAEYTTDEILNMLNLSPQEINTLQSLIDDNSISTNKTHSSSKINTDNQQILQEAKDYIDKQISKMDKKYKIINSTSEVTNSEYVYLLPNGTSCDRYILAEDGSPFAIGSMELDLSNVYTKDEINSDFIKKDEATATYSTIMTTDNISSNIGLLSNLNTEHKDNIVNAINELKTANDMLANTFANALDELGKLIGGDI